MDSLTLWLAYAFIFVGVYVTARTFFFQEEARSAKELLGEQDQQRRASNGIVKYARPLVSRYVAPTISNLKLEKYRKSYKQKLIAAGMVDEFTPDEVLGMKVFLFFAMPTMGAIGGWIGEMEFPFMAYVVMAGFGFVYTDMLIIESKTKRQKLVLRAMPFVVDLLALSTEAGLDFLGAIGKVVEKSRPSPLIEELEQVLKEIRVGSSRATALRDMAQRLGMQEVSSFVAVLVSADQMGASIGKVLRQQSDQIRNARFLAGESAGAKAVQKIMAPMLIFIFPAILIMIAAPFALNLFQQGGLGF